MNGIVVFCDNSGHIAEHHALGTMLRYNKISFLYVGNDNSWFGLMDGETDNYRWPGNTNRQRINSFLGKNAILITGEDLYECLKQRKFNSSME